MEPPHDARVFLAMPIGRRKRLIVWWDSRPRRRPVRLVVSDDNPPAAPPINYTSVSFWQGYFKK